MDQKELQSTIVQCALEIDELTAEMLDTANVSDADGDLNTSELINGIELIKEQLDEMFDAIKRHEAERFEERRKRGCPYLYTINYAGLDLVFYNPPRFTDK